MDCFNMKRLLVLFLALTSCATNQLTSPMNFRFGDYVLVRSGFYKGFEGQIRYEYGHKDDCLEHEYRVIIERNDLRTEQDFCENELESK